MPTTRNVTAPTIPKRQRAPSTRARKPSAKALQQNGEDDSELDTITVATEEDAPWTPRRSVAQENNGTPPHAGFRRFTREHGKQRNGNATLIGGEDRISLEFAGGSEERGTKFDELVGLIQNLQETIAQQTSLIVKQNTTIEVIRADLADVKEEQQNLTRQNTELQEQVHSLQSHVSANTAVAPPMRSWASVAGYQSRIGPTQLI